ncbi:hypothetical protein PUNSTDRAFT_140028 [Punctularia strigosozonata HHB-11173 SS5]|uniref:uncharacterized protein n=1 Tax=Punctularia strigosozonata (strain HHB-11173) TaxID=741275 RepID=UPI000441713F|nr:uncharacterized protein PUNSTDRAFT_140028 [Punctularia strigosozonata HHB-11173 SS5]EIN13503.1 hypothetical protein PUNSTDRAFT_140028 [Punctularia strigosozonata HHB-11173 SS5]
MVGIFGLAHKNSPSREPRPNNTNNGARPPPPPYEQGAQDHHAPVLVATTTTQVTTTTTETTTHFFSLPLWRRRGAQPPTESPTVAASHADPRTPKPDEVGVISLSRTASSTPNLQLRNKDLPPTPPGSSEGGSPQLQLGLAGPSGYAAAAVAAGRVSSSTIATTPGTEHHQSVLFPSQLATAPSNGSTTHALARAALGLGLMPQHAASASSSEVHTVAFATPDPSSSAASAPKAYEVRRAKSYGKLTKTGSSAVSSPDPHAQRRSRGLSLGPFHLATGAFTEGKGKERERVAVDDSGSGSLTPPKAVSRKSSFFSRKRYDSAAAAPSPSPSPRTQEVTLNATLPSLQPVSPFDMDLGPQQAGPSSLRRRHSERSQAHASPESSARATKPEPATVRPRTRRPSTADNARPRSAYVDPSSRATASASLLASPPPLPHLSAQSLLPPSSSTPHVLPSPLSGPGPSRIRAKTTPSTSILPRLSLSFSSNSHQHPAQPPSGESFFGGPTTSSPGPSAAPSPRQSFTKNAAELKPRIDEESPEVYLQRLTEAVNRAEIASILAASGDEFHARALRAYIGRFDFVGDPLDIALRKLLVDVGLPRETQQIDRVIEAFAARYLLCNPGLFTSEDHPYILAFSLIMLHTDAFNKSNKRKMTKADYIKNTRLPGVAPDVLDYFYDNIVFAPFIFIEDPLDVNGQQGVFTERTALRSMSIFGPPSGFSPNGSNQNASSTLLGKNNRIDPYYLITRNLLDPLRVDVEAYVPLESPFSYSGTSDNWDHEALQRAFAKAGRIEVDAGVSRPVSSAFFGLAVGGASTPIMGGGGSLSHTSGAFPDIAPPSRDVWTLKVTKIGVLSRKDDTVEGGKKASNRKWREWCVVLTGSQLLFFRDPTWAAGVLAEATATSADGQTTISHGSMLRPDELLSVKDAVAVFDRTYTKYPNTLRFVMADGRHILLQTSDETQLNEWISRINYASAFKSAGVRMRALGMTGQEIELTGMAAAASHLKDLHGPNHAVPGVRRWGQSVDETANGPPVPGSRSDSSLLPSPTSIHLTTDRLDLEVPVPNQVESATQFKATFDHVKADLASGRWMRADDAASVVGGRPRSYSLESTLPSPTTATTAAHRSRSGTSGSGSRLPSRGQIIQSKIRDLDSRLTATQTQLDADMRLVRHIAVLTPFQQSTRDRLRATVQGAAKKIALLRLELEKLACHRQVLATDMSAEVRDWRRTKKLALRAATDSLQSRLERGVPEISIPAEEPPESSPESSTPDRDSAELTHRHRDSNVTDSYHSAIDYGVDWASRNSSDVSANPSGSGSTLEVGRIVESPAMTPSTSDSPLELSFTNASRKPTLEASSSPGASPEQSKASLDAGSAEGGFSHEKFYTAMETTPEQAEEWNKTKAGKRVSLVKLPTDLRISTVFGVRSRARSDSTAAPSRRDSVTSVHAAGRQGGTSSPSPMP